MANNDRPSFNAELSSVSEFSSVEKANQLCDFLRTVLDKHAPHSLRKVITHKTSLLFKSITDELFIAKRKTSSREEMEEHKVNYFQGLVQTGKAQGFKTCAHSKCKYYTERIALASSSKELHQIVNTHSNRYPPKILPTIYHSADLPSIFIKHYQQSTET